MLHVAFKCDGTLAPVIRDEDYPLLHALRGDDGSFFDSVKLGAYFDFVSDCEHYVLPC